MIAELCKPFLRLFDEVTIIAAVVVLKVLARNVLFVKDYYELKKIGKILQGIKVNDEKAVLVSRFQSAI